MKTAALFLFIPVYAFAGSFAEFGIGYAVDGCLYDGWHRANNVTTINCSESPLGMVSIGYQFSGSGFTIQADHWSSLIEQDKGISSISVRYRFNFGE